MNPFTCLMVIVYSVVTSESIQDSADIKCKHTTEDDTYIYIIHVNIKYTKSKRLCGSMNMNMNENLMDVNHLCVWN